MKSRNNKTIECFRLLAAIMIVLIHCPLPDASGRFVIAFARSGVPFFLMVSGFYSYGENCILRARKKLKDIAKLLLTGGLACMIWNCVNSLLAGNTAWEWLTGYMNYKTLVELVLFNRATFFNSVFYYFFMLLYIYIMYILLNKAGWITYAYYLIVPALAASFFILKCTDLPWYYSGNFLLTGMPMFLIGHYLHEHERITEWLKGKEWFFAAAGVLFSVGERSLLQGGYMNLGCIVVAAAMLAFAINHPAADHRSIIAWLGTACSIPVIMFHCQIRDSLDLLLNIPETLMPLAVTGASLAFALLIYALKAAKNDIIHN